MERYRNHHKEAEGRYRETFQDSITNLRKTMLSVTEDEHDPRLGNNVPHGVETLTKGGLINAATCQIKALVAAIEKLLAEGETIGNEIAALKEEIHRRVSCSDTT